MEGDLWIRLGLSLALILCNAFFVAAEYALVSSRKSRLESLAKRGNRSARRVIDALNNMSNYVAGSQLGVSIFSIGVGAVTEPFVTDLLEKVLGSFINGPALVVISIFIVTFVLVVIGELVPKYVTLSRPERMAMLFITPLWLFVTIFKPFIYLVERTGGLLVRPLGINVRDQAGEAIPREELLLLVKAGSSEGVIDKVHADMVSKAMQIDRLMARDVMIHRLDINWLDCALTRDEAIVQLGKIAHTRVPICRGDIDDVVGIAYVNDVVKHWNDPDFSLEKIARPPTIIPESLTLDRIVTRMRESKSQIVVVVDEYGGTSGLITLEDVVEEVFGELEDSLEHERPQIELIGTSRVSARADVRFDELVDELGIELDELPDTSTLATMMVEALERMPKLGDSVETPIGVMRIENMARRRVTRVSIQLSTEIQSRLVEAN